MKSRIVIGDVHGCYLTLMALIAKLPKGIPITISGDLIDRGPRSREVVQWCIDNNIDVTMGNHEQMMAIESPYWLMNGGYECLESYGCMNVPSGSKNHIVFQDDESIQVYAAHQKWMSELPLYLEYKDVVNAEGRYLVVSHSAVSPVWKFKERGDEKNPYFAKAVLWGRPSTINDVKTIYNVFGHTIQEDGPRIRVPFANIDTGAFWFTNRKCAKLTALQYPEMTVYQQDNVDYEIKYE